MLNHCFSKPSFESIHSDWYYNYCLLLLKSNRMEKKTTSLRNIQVEGIYVVISNISRHTTQINWYELFSVRVCFVFDNVDIEPVYTNTVRSCIDNLYSGYESSRVEKKLSLIFCKGNSVRERKTSKYMIEAKHKMNLLNPINVCSISISERI